MEKVEILGIVGSPRKKGHTAFMVKQALEAAREVEGVETEIIYLIDKKIGPCRSCSDENGQLTCATRPRCIQDDDMTNEIYGKLLAADGIIIGSPVYWCNVSSYVKTFMDRTIWIKMRKLWLRDKVGGALTVAAHRHGGQEVAIEAIENFFRIHGMIIVGDGAPNSKEYEEFENVTYGSPSSDAVPAIWGRAHFAGGWADPYYGEIKKDVMAIINAKGLGRHVAEVAKWVKAFRPKLELKAYSMAVPSRARNKHSARAK